MRLMWNDIKQNKLQTLATEFFLAVAAFGFGLTIFLFGSLLGSIGSLMQIAEVPDFLQMHAGEINEMELLQFSEENEQIADMQLARFLNLENAIISLNGNSLSESTQDNGVCVQNESFDYLLDMQNERAMVTRGEIYVPVCYMRSYQLDVGQMVQIGEKIFVIKGFLRDAQMNSMMASSKRFLVHESDYNELREIGSEEYLIEFRMKSESDLRAFENAYIEAKLPANGPTITRPLIRLMNALSDGIMIMVILIISVVVLLIAILCVRFILLANLEKTKREIGLLKAIGISKKDIRRIYLTKYILLSAIGAMAGFVGALVVSIPLGKGIARLYGPCTEKNVLIGYTIAAVILVELLILYSVYRTIRKTDRISVLQSLYGNGDFGKKKKSQYILCMLVVAAGLFLMILPENISSTIANPGFVSCMGIGSGEIRLDVRQTSQIAEKTREIANIFTQDEAVVKYVSLCTSPLRVELPDGSESILSTEYGNHSVFPVRYSEGRAPERKGELALSILNAKELGLSVGDTICVTDSVPYEAVICGLYSDITNGGKTAKAFALEEEMESENILWSIFYVELSEQMNHKEWMEDCQKQCEEVSEQGVKITEIADYLQGTYGQTIQALQQVAVLAKGISLLVILVVVTLFLRLIVEQDRQEISLKKAIGLSGRVIQMEFLRPGLFYAVGGIVLGLVFGNVFGQSLVGMILSNFGVGEFEFVSTPWRVYVLLPLLTVATLVVAVLFGCGEIKRIRAYECLVGKEQ